VKLFLKKIFKWFLFKMRHPLIEIGFGSSVNENVRIGGKLTVGTFSEILVSELEGQISIGDKCYLKKVKIHGPVRIGNECKIENSSIGRFTYVTEKARINYVSIGHFCSIGPELMCGLGLHPKEWVSTSPVFYSARKQCGVSFADRDYFDEVARTEIGNDVHIGARVYIRDGIKIGNGVIIGAGAVVVEDVPDFAIVAGSPARLIRFRFDDRQIEELNRIEWWNWPEGYLRDFYSTFNQRDIGKLLTIEQRLKSHEGK
jgi:acetyltransferase-like isoleucine patch superfamily enzyme